MKRLALLAVLLAPQASAFEPIADSDAHVLRMASTAPEGTPGLVGVPNVNAPDPA